jgi:hypothetical protein
MMPPGPFALAPAKAVTGPLDFTKPEHSKIYKSAIRAVLDDAFNCEADGRFQFLWELQKRSTEMGLMEGILKIPMGKAEDKEDEVEEENILKNYRSVTLAQVVNLELRYVNDQDRKAQETRILYRCLMSSLTSEAKKTVMIWSDQYRIGDNKMSSGVGLLTVVIRERHLDTNTTTIRSGQNCQRLTRIFLQSIVTLGSLSSM